MSHTQEPASLVKARGDGPSAVRPLRERGLGAERNRPQIERPPAIAGEQQPFRSGKDAQQQVLGQTNAFTIDTRYSGRDPNTILPAEIIEDRTTTNRRSLTIDQVLDLAVRNSREYQTRK